MYGNKRLQMRSLQICIYQLFDDEDGGLFYRIFYPNLTEKFMVNFNDQTRTGKVGVGDRTSLDPAHPDTSLYLAHPDPALPDTAIIS